MIHVLRVRVLAVGVLGVLVNSGCGGKPETVDEGVPVPNESRTAPESGKPDSEQVEGWGTLKGRVTFAGDPPTPKVLVSQGEEGVKDSEICARHEIEDESLVVDPETRGVKWALVYLPRPSKVNPEAESEARSEPVVFDQKDCVFRPHVLAVMSGNEVRVTSSDPAGHNVHSLLRGMAFNQGLPPNGSMTLEVERADGRPGQVVCDVHPWMSSWWLTLDNPYFAVTDEDGSYEIRNVPAGAQKVVVWNEAAGYLTPPTGSPVKIEPDGETTKDVVIEAGDVKRRK